MLRITDHVPDLVTTLTFPADSSQHQQSILTLATHLLLTIPVITQQQSWDIIRETTSHRHTLQLILATVTLQRHHLVWHTVMTNPLRPSIYISFQRQPYHTNRNAEPSLIQNIDLQNDSVTHDLNPRWLMSAIGSLPTGEVKSLVPRSE